MQIHRESSSKRVLWFGSKSLISIDESNEIPHFSGADCAVNDRAESETLHLSPFDISYVGSIPGIAMSHTGGTTVGLLRSIDDVENVNLDLSPLSKFCSKAYHYHEQILVLPDPLSIIGRESILQSFQSDEGIQLCHKQFIFSNTQALVLSFLKSREGSQLLQTQMGTLKLIVLQFGEDYCCASAVDVESIFPHDHCLINERNGNEHEESFLDTHESSFAKFTPKLEIDRLHLNTLASEGHLGFGLQDVDELILHDWLAVMYHLAKAMKIKKPDKSWRLSKEALDGHNHHHSTVNHGRHHKVPEELVNGVEGFKWWVKLSPYNRTRCLRAMSLFRCACNHDGNFLGKTQSPDQDLYNSNLSLYKQLLDAGSFGERVKLLSDFLFNECDSILQSLTGWVSIQGESILHQLLEQYGNDAIKVEVKLQASIKYLCIDGSKDFVADDDALSQTDAASIAETIYYDIYCRPTIRTHLNQILKGLRRKLDCLGLNGADSTNSKVLFDSMLLWSEIATNVSFGEEHINNIVIKEATRHFNIRSIKCHKRKKTGHEKSHHFADDEGQYSCGTKVTSNELCASQQFYCLHPTVLLEGLRSLIDLVPHIDHHSFTKSYKPDRWNFFQSLSLSEVVCTSSWCGNIGFALVKEPIGQVGKIELSTNDIIWLTDFKHPKKRKRSDRRRLKDMNNYFLELNLPKSAINIPESELHEPNVNFPASVTIYRCHSQTINIDSGELRGVLESVSSSHPNSRCFFLDNRGSSSLLGCNHVKENSHSHDELFQREFSLIYFQEKYDSYGNVNGISPMCEESPVRQTDSSIMDDSFLSSSTAQSTSQYASENSMLHTSHLPPHEEQQLRNSHSFYQRHNRHRRGHSFKQQHYYHHRYQQAHHRVPAQYGHATHNHHQQKHSAIDASIISSSQLNHSQSEINDKYIDGRIGNADATNRWKLLIVRSTGVYSINAAQNALLGDSTDSNDDFYGCDNSVMHETLVHENIHILHWIPLDSKDGVDANEQCYRFVSMNFSENGIFTMKMTSLMSEEEFVYKYPLPPSVYCGDEEVDIDFSDEVTKKKQELDIKQQILSLVSMLLPVTDNHIGAGSHSTILSPPKKSKERKIYKFSSRNASILFALLLFLYAVFSLTFINGTFSLWYSKLSNNSCNRNSAETKNDIYVAPFLESGTLDVHRILDDPDISSTDSDLDEIHNLHLLHDDSCEINNQLLEEKSNKIKYSQLIFVSKSHFARLRYVLHRLKGSIAGTLGVVCSMMVNAFKRFPFGFTGHH